MLAYIFESPSEPPISVLLHYKLNRIDRENQSACISLTCPAVAISNLSYLTMANVRISTRYEIEPKTYKQKLWSHNSVHAAFSLFPEWKFSQICIYIQCGWDLFSLFAHIKVRLHCTIHPKWKRWIKLAENIFDWLYLSVLLMSCTK